MLKFLAEMPKWALAISATVFAGCSIHPIPDDVSRYSTDEIVHHVRCEAKDAVRDEISKALEKYRIWGIEADYVLEPANFARIRHENAELAAKFLGYGASSISYDFEFQITENNDRSGTLLFGMPFVNSAGLTLGLDGGVSKARNAIRKFKTVETFKELKKLRCGESQMAGGRQRAVASRAASAAQDGIPDLEPNFLYPMTGSIGVRKIMQTFIRISELGGGKGDYSDAITFTTEVRAGVKPTLVLAPLVDRFRLVNATGDFSDKRNDLHKVIITLAFPKIPPVVNKHLSVGPAIVDIASRETLVRASINSCIASAEAREDQFSMLRQIPPQDFCERSALALTEGSLGGR